MNTIINALSLIVSIVTLVFLIKYVRATETIAKQSREQVEAAFRPALVAVVVGPVNKPPALVNVGTGTAVVIGWSILNSKHSGTIPYLQSGEKMPLVDLIEGMKPIYETGAQGGPEPPQIKCGYSSISGELYRSTSGFDLEDDSFTKTFEHGSNFGAVYNPRHNAKLE